MIIRFFRRILPKIPSGRLPVIVSPSCGSEDMRTTLVSFVALIAIACPAIAQQQSFREHFLEETIREHMRVRPLPDAQTAATRQSAARAAAARQAEREERDGIAIAPALRAEASASDWVETVVSDDLYPESEVHAVVNPVDPANFVVSSIRQQVYQGQIADLSCPLYYTRDDGANWQLSPFLTTPGASEALTVGGGDPVLAADADGTLYFSWLGFYLPSTFDRLISELYWVYSTDRGASWVRPEKDVIARADMPLNGSVQHFVDKQWLAVDRSGAATRGTLYAAFLRVSDSRMRIVLRRKLPGALQFSTEEVSISPESQTVVQFTSIDVDTEGGVHVTWFGSTDENHFSLWHARSVDGGESFPEVTKISDLIFPKFSIEDRMGEIPGMSTQRMYPCPQLAADKGAYPGFLYMTWTANGIIAKEGNGTDIYFTRSTDNGRSWEAARIINDDEKGIRRDQFHPSIAVNAQGVVAVTWYDRREDSTNRSARYYIAVSRDGGARFLPNRPVAAMPMDMYKAKEDNSEFGIGEYTQVILTDTEAIPFWSDGRSNDGNIDVYSARMILATLDVEEMAPLSADFRISGAFPAPARDRLQLRIDFDRRMEARLLVGDLLGRVLLEYSGTFEAGAHDVVFDVSALTPGNYHVVLQTDAGSATKMVQILR
jgi:hypothetical protein